MAQRKHKFPYSCIEGDGFVLLCRHCGTNDIEIIEDITFWYVKVTVVCSLCGRQQIITAIGL
jgi:hypothetical protein